MAGLARHLRVEHDLELKVAQLVGETCHVVARDRVGDFVGFLDGVGRDGGEGLDAVPVATRDRIAEVLHDLHKPIEVLRELLKHRASEGSQSPLAILPQKV